MASEPLSRMVMGRRAGPTTHHPPENVGLILIIFTVQNINRLVRHGGFPYKLLRYSGK